MIQQKRRTKRILDPSVSARKKSSGRLLWGRILKWLAIPFLTLFVGAFVAGVLIFATLAAGAPKLDIHKITSQPNTVILDKDDHKVAELGAEMRINTSNDQIPMTLVDAITSIEDHRFFDHRGIDPIRIMGSVLHIIGGGTLQGGSTLTQELIKLSFFSTAASDQTLTRKAQEAWLAIQLDNRMSKEQILTFYVNKVYMANGNYGMQTASQNMYQKSLKDLSIAQTALLAGMPQAPNNYDPYTNPDAAKWRRDLVLQAMLRYGTISKAQYDEAIATPVTEGLHPVPQVKSIPQYLDNYVTEVINQVKDQTGKDPLTVGMKIYTPLDNEAQKRLYDIYNTDEYVIYPNDDLQVASTVVDSKTGAVIAQLGGRKQPGDVSLGFNQAVTKDRDWGSTNKPVTDYGPALDNDVYTSTAQSVLDAPYNFPGTTIPVNDWDGRFLGSMTIRYAIWQSRNVPAVKTLAAVGYDKSLAFLNKVGIYYPDLVPSNAISSLYKIPDKEGLDPKYGTSSENMAAAFASFSNGGTYNQPYYVSKVTYNDGTSKTFKFDSHRAMRETTAYMMTDMLKGVIPNGTNGSTFPPNRLNIYQAGKTGTSNYADNEMQTAIRNLGSRYDGYAIPDELWVGYTTDYTMAVWTGYKDRLIPLNLSDTQIAGSVYTALFQYLYQNKTSTDWEMPDGLQRVGKELYLKDANQSKTSASSSAAPTTPSSTLPTSSTKSANDLANSGDNQPPSTTKSAQ